MGFGQFIVVQFRAQLFAEGGAHVVHVESLEGNPMRHIVPQGPSETRHFVSRNFGKHTLPLDLRHAKSRAGIDRLFAGADVVLTNFRPGVAAELGLDRASLAMKERSHFTITILTAKFPTPVRAWLDVVVALGTAQPGQCLNFGGNQMTT